jgi:hypothetical protein
MAKSLAPPWQSRNDVAQLRRFNWPRETGHVCRRKWALLGAKRFSRRKCSPKPPRKEPGDPGAPAHKFTRANDFMGLTPLCATFSNSQAASVPRRRAIPDLGVPASGATMASAGRAPLRQAQGRLPRPRSESPKDEDRGRRPLRFRRRRGPKQRKRKEFSRKRNERFRAERRKSLRSLGARNHRFRESICFQWVNRLFVSPSRRMRSPDPKSPGSSGSRPSLAISKRLTGLSRL